MVDPWRTTFDDPRGASHVRNEQAQTVDKFEKVAGKTQTRTDMMTVVLGMCEGTALGCCHSHYCTEREYGLARALVIVDSHDSGLYAAQAH